MVTDILTAIAHFLLISSGSVFCCSLFHVKYEKTLPVTGMGMVFAVFFIGLLFSLKAAFTAVLAAVALLYAFAFYHLVRKRDFRQFADSLFTPGFFLFVLLYIAIFIINYGKMLASWDEFSHWGAAAKIMTTKGLFVADKGSGALFPSYPPAITIFQYIMQQLKNDLCSQTLFTEWMLYYAYQIFLAMLLMPFVSDVRMKDPLPLGILCTIALLPSAFLNNMFAKIYSEPILGALLGTGLAHLVFDEEAGMPHRLTLICTAAILPIMKMSGILFGAILLAAMALRYGKEDRKTLLCALGATLSTILAWGCKLMACHTLSSLGYRNSGVAGAFIRFFLTRNINYSDTVRIPLPPIILWLAILCLIWALADRGVRLKRLSFAIAAYLFFFVALCISYRVAFIPQEAQELAGLQRYIQCGFFAGFLFVALSIWEKMKKGRPDRCAVWAYLLCVLVMVPWMTDARFLLRRTAAYSVSFRRPYEVICEQVRSFRDYQGRPVFLISGDVTGLDQIVLSYSLPECPVIELQDDGVVTAPSDGAIFADMNTLGVREEW